MREKWIWTVRLIGVVVFLLLMYLLMSLHAQLVKLNEEQPKASRPVSLDHAASDGSEGLLPS